ncbi:MAG TPA: cupin domain-containing protein, partial [Dysgonomonas sp.]|nr:cupin domain-containing protein [Dysgonomonas sp.]
SKEHAKHYIWGSKCDSWVFVDKENLSVKLECMPPDTKENIHYHTKALQFFYILKGEAIFHIHENEVNIRAQEGILISPQTIHFIENRSNERIDFLVISQPTTNNDRFSVNRNIQTYDKD